MFVIEARNANDKIVGRAEYDNADKTDAFVEAFKSARLVATIRVIEDEVEKFRWER